MSRKSKGIDAERELVHLFNENLWGAIRVAGSGSSRFPSPDILAGNKVRRLAIECKTSKKPVKYLTKEEIGQLMVFSDMFGAEAWVAVRFREWYFLSVGDITKTEKSYVITLEEARQKGLLFEELVRD